MILVDANLLIYASIGALPQHPRSHQWLDNAFSSFPRVGLPWHSLLAFVRIVSNARAFSKAVPLARAWQQVETWLAIPTVWVPCPTEHHQRFLGQALNDASSSHHVSDAHLAALAMEHGLELNSTDGDFARFRGLRWRNPLA